MNKLKRSQPLPSQVLEIALPVRWHDVSLVARGPTVPACAEFEAFDCTVLVMAKTGERVWVDVPFEVAEREWDEHLHSLAAPTVMRAALVDQLLPALPGMLAFLHGAVDRAQAPTPSDTDA